MRKLPIYFLIDVSESMVGMPIQQVEEGLATIMQTLKTDPNALETVWVSISVFAGKAKTIVPLQEISSFYPPKFPIGSGTSLSAGLEHIMAELEKNTVKTTSQQKGDWKPIVFLFTDGIPTDDSQRAITKWKENWKKKANLVAISFGNETDSYILSELTETVLQFNNTDATAYKQFFKWVTSSIQASSVSVENTGKEIDLAVLDGQTLSKIDLAKVKPSSQTVDTNFVILAGKCQNLKNPYLMKYKKEIRNSNLGDLKLDTQVYKLVGAFQVENSYYDLSSDIKTEFKVNTEELIGSPTCPCCGNQFAFAVCSCQKIHCIGEEEVSTCPWCGNKATYGIGGDSFDINRTQG